MTKSVNNVLMSLLVIFCFFVGAKTAYAHPMLPPEAMDYLYANPNATPEEFDNFLSETYGEEELSAPSSDVDGPMSLWDRGGFSDESIHQMRKDLALLLSPKEQNKTFFQNAKDFIVLGIEHILIGLDHILFVVSLVLVLLPWKKILSMVSVFTIAHSLTLILAGSNILTLSAKVVEPIIAFSIAYMAITTVFLKNIGFFQKLHGKIGTIFLFGLFHGLGFAGVFSDLKIPSDKYLSSLLFFNVGVEVGQILILIVVVPALIYLSRNEKVYDVFTKSVAAVISLLSIFWLIQRIFI